MSPDPFSVTTKTNRKKQSGNVILITPLNNDRCATYHYNQVTMMVTQVANAYSEKVDVVMELSSNNDVTT